MNVRINDHVISYVKENEKDYQGVTIKENDIWHLRKITQNKSFVKEKNMLDLQKEDKILQIPMRLVNLKNDIMPE
jgi:3-phenylpropionate/cinnamic acid dioxygenase small subunit